MSPARDGWMVERLDRKSSTRFDKITFISEQQNENERNMQSRGMELHPEDVRQFIIEPWLHQGLKEYGKDSVTLPTYDQVQESDRLTLRRLANGKCYHLQDTSKRGPCDRNDITVKNESLINII